MNRLIKWLNIGASKTTEKSKSKFCSKDDFFEILNWERIRSKRDYLPLTNLVISFIKCDRKSMVHYNNFLKEVIPLIEKYTRASDIKCIIGVAQINILLIDTSLLNGHLVQERVHQLLIQHFQHKNQVFHKMIEQIEYHLSPIVFGIDSQNKRYVTNKFQHAKQQTDTIAVNF